ncbi:Os02g0802250, partial [Oryza sativa Japonica Group]
TVVSASSLADPRDGGRPCRLQYPLETAECAGLAVEVRRVKNFINQVRGSYQGLDCRCGESSHPSGLALFC